MKRRIVKNTANYDYPRGEKQFEYNRGQFLFREPYKHPFRWDQNTINSLVRLLRATVRPEAWEFLLKEHYGRPWYIVRVYHPNRRDSPVIVLDSDSLNVFVAQCCFYAVGFRAKLMDSVYGGLGIGEEEVEEKLEIGKNGSV